MLPTSPCTGCCFQAASWARSQLGPQATKAQQQAQSQAGGHLEVRQRYVTRWWECTSAANMQPRAPLVHWVAWPIINTNTRRGDYCDRTLDPCRRVSKNILWCAHPRTSSWRHFAQPATGKMHPLTAIAPIRPLQARLRGTAVVAQAFKEIVWRCTPSSTFLAPLSLSSTKCTHSLLSHSLNACRRASKAQLEVWRRSRRLCGAWASWTRWTTSPLWCSSLRWAGQHEDLRKNGRKQEPCLQA